jgi:hypothetical protein
VAAHLLALGLGAAPAFGGAGADQIASTSASPPSTASINRPRRKSQTSILENSIETQAKFLFPFKGLHTKRAFAPRNNTVQKRPKLLLDWK